MDRRLLVFGAFAALVLQGCSGGAPLSYTQWVTSEAPSPEANSGYAAYCRAAELAEKSAGDLADTVNFTTGKRRQLIAKLGPALKELNRGLSASTIGYEPATTPLGATPKNHCGFRLLGLALQFRIQDAIEKEDYGTAIQNARYATRFGFDLCNGSALDASLGMSIANDARTTLIPALPRMTSKQLQEVASTFRKLLDNRPSMMNCLENERKQMLREVQSLQESFLRGDGEKLVLRLNLPSSARKAIVNLKEKSGPQRLAFFKGFADEVETKSRYWRELVALPASLRDPKEERIKPIKFAPDRPWRVYADHFCSLGEPLVVMNDDNLARTRLMVLEAAILSKTKAGNNAPKAITTYNEVAVDPYTGRLFAYHADGKEFRVYSTGPNLVDDGGEVGDTGPGLDVFMN